MRVQTIYNNEPTSPELFLCEDLDSPDTDAVSEPVYLACEVCGQEVVVIVPTVPAVLLADADFVESGYIFIKLRSVKLKT